MKNQYILAGKFSLLATLLAWATGAAAQQVDSTQSVLTLEETVISASKFEEKRSDVPQQIQVIRARDMQWWSQPTTAEVLSQSGGVLVQKSQLGGGSPILRGFEASRVLMVVDGVRMNNAIYRAGHLQNVITIDNNTLERAEIVFGAGSVMYGSDALGGVMHFHTKKPQLSKTTGGGFVRYGSAMNEMTGHVDVNLGNKRLASFTSATFSNFGDAHSGNLRNPAYGDWGKRLWYVERINKKDSIIKNDDATLQKFSGYWQTDIMQKVLFQQSENVSHSLNVQFSTSSDVYRYDRLAEWRNGKPRSAQWYYGPQKRLFASYTLDLKNTKLYDHARVIAAYQDIEESRHDRNFGSTTLNHRVEKVKIYSANVDAEKRLGKQELRYGLEFYYNDVNSTATQENVDTGETKPQNTRYPDGGSQMTSLAAYLTDTWEISEKFLLNAGVRYNSIGLQAKFNDKTFFPFPFNDIQQNPSALTGSAGFVLRPGADWRIAGSFAQGFRAPNVDDLSRVFESAAGKQVIVPNPNIKPEYTNTVDLTLGKVFANKVQAEITGYYTAYTNAITVQNSTFNGQDSIMYNGQMSRVQSAANTDKAYLYGCTGSLAADVTRNFALTSSLTYTYARIRGTNGAADSPLDHIPPIYGRTGIVLKDKKFKGEFYALYNGWKRIQDMRLGAEDNEVYGTPNGFPAWCTLNVRMGYTLSKYLNIQAAVENIADVHYRVFASGFSAPGRNVVITLRSQF